MKRIWRTAKQPFDALWKWATGHPKRWKKLVEWTSEKRRYARSKHRIQKAKFWAAKRTVYRKKWRKAKRRLDAPEYEAWMANGHEGWNLTARAQDLLAVAVVTYDLTCTSITRNWGTGSHHERIPTHGFDCAGARMADFQRDLRYGRIKDFHLGDLLELIGPDNAAWAKNGAPWSGAEGTSLEQMHDNHTHAFVF